MVLIKIKYLNDSENKLDWKQKRIHKIANPFLLKVVPLGIEPRLFWTKTRRVASYTMGQ